VKYTTVNLGENRIEIYNSILGKETIKVNGKTVSEKYSIFGTEHKFKVIENGNEMNCKIVLGFSINGIVFDLYKDDKPIIVSPKFGCTSLLIFIILISISLKLFDKVL